MWDLVLDLLGLRRAVFTRMAMMLKIGGLLFAYSILAMFLAKIFSALF